jgi:hypothetical protein
MSNEIIPYLDDLIARGLITQEEYDRVIRDPRDYYTELFFGHQADDNTAVYSFIDAPSPGVTIEQGDYLFYFKVLNAEEIKEVFRPDRPPMRMYHADSVIVYSSDNRQNNICGGVDCVSKYGLRNAISDTDYIANILLNIKSPIYYEIITPCVNCGELLRGSGSVWVPDYVLDPRHELTAHIYIDGNMLENPEYLERIPPWITELMGLHTGNYITDEDLPWVSWEIILRRNGKVRIQETCADGNLVIFEFTEEEYTDYLERSQAIYEEAARTRGRHIVDVMVEGGEIVRAAMSHEEYANFQEWAPLEIYEYIGFAVTAADFAKFAE